MKIINPKMLLGRMLFGIAILIGWQGAAWSLGPYWISSPMLVAHRLYEMAANGDLWFHARFTLAEAITGFVLGAFPAAAIALSLRRHPFAEAAVGAIAVIGYAIPKVALAPLFILWFGIGAESKIALVASAIFFIVFYSTLRGVKNLDQQLLMYARMLGASEWQLVKVVVWPAVIPFLFGGLRVAVPYSIAGAVVGEIISSNRGLGYLTQYGAMDFDTTLIFSAVVVVMLIVTLINTFLTAVQRRLSRWKQDMDFQSTSTAVA